MDPQSWASFRSEMEKDAKEAEGKVSKWIRKYPVLSRALLGAPIAGAVSAKKGEKAKSFAKGVGATAAGTLGGGGLGAGAGTMIAKLLKKDPGAGALIGMMGGSQAGNLYGNLSLARRLQKKHEKTGEAKTAGAAEMLAEAKAAGKSVLEKGKELVGKGVEAAKKLPTAAKVGIGAGAAGAVGGGLYAALKPKKKAKKEE